MVVFLTALTAAVAGTLVNQRLSAEVDYALGQKLLADQHAGQAAEQTKVAQQALEDLRKRTEAEQKANAHALLQYRTTLYVRNIADAFKALGDYRSDEAERFLNAADEDLRGWEWSLMNRRRNRSPVVVPGPYTCVAFHPSGKTLASGRSDGGVHLFHAADLSRGPEFQWHDQPLVRLSFDPTGKYLATLSRKGLLLVAEADTGKELFRFQGQSNGKVLTFTPDGTALVHRDGRANLRMAEVPGGRERSLFPSNGDVAFLNDGRRAVSLVPGGCKVWDVATGKEVLKIDKGDPLFSPDQCAADPNGRWTALGTSLVDARVHDAETGKVVWQYQPPSAPSFLLSRLTFSADGSRLVGQAKMGGIVIWEAATGRVQHVLNDAQNHFSEDLAISRDVDRIATVGSGKKVGLKVWHLPLPLESFAFDEKAGADAGRPGVSFLPQQLTFTEDGRELCFRVGSHLVRLDAETGRETSRIKSSHDKAFMIWNLMPNGNDVAGVTAAGGIDFIDVRSGEKRAATAESIGPVTATMPFGTGLLAARTKDLRVVVFNASDGTLKYSLGNVGAFITWAFSVNGRHLAVSQKQRVAVWDLAEAREVAVIPHRASAWSLAFRPDGTQLAVGYGDGVLRVYDVTTGNQAWALPGHTKIVKLLAYTPDGKRIASCDDRVTRLIDAVTGQEMFAIPFKAEFPGHLAFSLDNRQLAVTLDRTVRVFDSGPVTGKDE